MMSSYLDRRCKRGGKEESFCIQRRSKQPTPRWVFIKTQFSEGGLGAVLVRSKAKPDQEAYHLTLRYYESTGSLQILEDQGPCSTQGRDKRENEPLHGGKTSKGDERVESELKPGEKVSEEIGGEMLGDAGWCTPVAMSQTKRQCKKE